jgi:hypothetical protein
MLRIIKIVAALAALVFGFIWLLSTISTGFSAPDWVPATCGFAAGVYVVIDALVG